MTSSPSISTAGRWDISEVTGRKMPWRVHRVGTDPRISADGVFATKGEAEACLTSLRAPMKTVAHNLRPMESR